MNHSPTTELLPPDAAAELCELLLSASRRERAVLRAYMSQGSLGAVGTMRLTPLHIAAMYQCVALTRELLQQGADPGARLKPQELTNYPGCLEPPPRTPLLWMLNNLTTWADGFDALKINRIIDLLMQHGADVRGREGGQALYYCAAALIDGSEEIFLHLLDLGARTHTGYLPEQALCCHGMVLYAGFERAAKRLIAEGLIDINGREANGDRFLTRTLYTVGRFYACSIPFFDEETAENIYRRNLISLRLLLEHGAEGINDVHPREGAPASTALSFIIERLPQHAKPHQVERAGELIQLLMHYGADLHMPITVEGQGTAQNALTAADMLRDKPALAAWWQQHVEGIRKEHP